MNRPDLFLQGNESFTDGIMQISRSVKRIADRLEAEAPTKKMSTSGVIQVEDQPIATKRVIYCLTDWKGEVKGPR
jgi:hypothetical protein